MARSYLAGRTQEAKFRLTVTGDAAYGREYRSGTHMDRLKLQQDVSYSRKLRYTTQLEAETEVIMCRPAGNFATRHNWRTKRR